jgi:predicted metalloendopeptidase
LPGGGSSVRKSIIWVREWLFVKWYDAFKIRPESQFYIPPEQRVRIW